MKAPHLICACLLIGPAMAGAEPVALVLEVEGEVSPPVEPFAEIGSGVELTLGSGAALTLEHYATCEQVSMRGGTVGVGAEKLDLSRAESVARRPVPCPEVIRLTEATVNAGVVLRSVVPPDAQEIGLTPMILVAGDAGIDRMRIEQDGLEVATLPVVAGRVLWPEGGFLVDGGHYRLVLSAGPATWPVDVVADRDASERVVLRLSPAE